MSQPKLAAPIPRFALTRNEAAASLSMGTTAFDEHVAPDLKVIRRGRIVLYPTAEIAAWAAASAEPVLPGVTARGNGGAR